MNCVGDKGSIWVVQGGYWRYREGVGNTERVWIVQRGCVVHGGCM
jgi:hypothetical protein